MKPVRKIKFNQLKNSMVAFCGNIEKKLQEVVDDIPVFMILSGDAGYWQGAKYNKDEEKKKEIYQKVPRVTINLEDFQPDTAQNTNSYVKTTYNNEEDNENYQGNFRRNAILTTVQVDIVLSNLVYAMEYIEIGMGLFSKDRVYSFNSNAITFQANYNFQSMGLQKPEMNFGSENKNFILRFGVELTTQVFVADYSTLKKLDGDTDFIGGGEVGAKPVFNFIVKNDAGNGKPKENDENGNPPKDSYLDKLEDNDPECPVC